MGWLPEPADAKARREATYTVIPSPAANTAGVSSDASVAPRPSDAKASSSTSTPTRGADPQSKEKGPPATLFAAFGTIRPHDFSSVHKTPCARESFLAGLGAGFGIGGLRLVFGGM